MYLVTHEPLWNVRVPPEVLKLVALVHLSSPSLCPAYPTKIVLLNWEQTAASSWSFPPLQSILTSNSFKCYLRMNTAANVNYNSLFVVLTSALKWVVFIHSILACKSWLTEVSAASWASKSRLLCSDSSRALRICSSRSIRPYKTILSILGDNCSNWLCPVSGLLYFKNIATWRLLTQST